MWIKPVDGPGPTVAQWSPAVGLVALGWGIAGAAAVLGVLAPDAPGRLIAAVAAVMLALAAGYGTRARPRLAADRHGIVARGLGGPAGYAWSAVEGLQVVHTRRWGRETALLEIDVRDEHGAERLLLFGRLDLDADPVQVGQHLAALRADAEPGQPR